MQGGSGHRGARSCGAGHLHSMGSFFRLHTELQVDIFDMLAFADRSDRVPGPISSLCNMRASGLIWPKSSAQGLQTIVPSSCEKSIDSW